MIKSIFSSSCWKLFGSFCSFFSIPILMDVLSVNEYALWVTLTSLIGWINLFDFGAGYSLRNRVAEYNELNEQSKLKTAISGTFTFYFLTSIVLLLIFTILLFTTDILNNNGYETWFAKSADHKFAYTDLFYKSHGYRNIIDGSTLTQNLTKQEIAQNKSSYGGLSDKLLFSHILNLFQTQQIQEPFLFTMFTVDTHVPGTVLPYNCKKIFGNVRDNILCSDKVVTDFINEFKQTPYWENTSIVILGDHPMFKPLSVHSDKDYKRTIYNVFLNLPNKLKINPKKAYTALDLAPSYLEILGINLPNQSFGLGRSIFSDTPSLITHKDYNIKTAVRQKSQVYQDFSKTTIPQFYPYELGAEINNNNIKTYTQYSETVLNYIFINNLGLKLSSSPTKDLEMELTLNAMLSSDPCLTIKLNTEVLDEIELEKKSGPQTIKVILPKERISTPDLNLEFINNNFRSAVSQSINIQKLVIKEIQ